MERKEEGGGGRERGTHLRWYMHKHGNLAIFSPVGRTNDTLNYYVLSDKHYQNTVCYIYLKCMGLEGGRVSFRGGGHPGILPSPTKQILNEFMYTQSVCPFLFCIKFPPPRKK